MGQTRSEEVTNAFQIIATPQGTADYPDGALDAPARYWALTCTAFFTTMISAGIFEQLAPPLGLPDNKGGAGSNKDREYDKLAELVRRNLDIAKSTR